MVSCLDNTFADMSALLNRPICFEMNFSAVVLEIFSFLTAFSVR